MRVLLGSCRPIDAPSLHHSSLRSGVRERDLLRREGDEERERPALRSVSWGVLGGERERERDRPL